jgi:hypothetical protein
MSDIQRTEKPEPTTRVDAAHPFEASGALPKAEVSPPDLLEAIAGLNSGLAAKQLKGQTLELAAFLQKKQDLLDRREAELNARLAMLESESRATRLRFSDPLADDDVRPVKSPPTQRPRPTDRPHDSGIVLDDGAEIASLRKPPPVEISPPKDEPIPSIGVGSSDASQWADAESTERILSARLAELNQRDAQVQRIHDEAVTLHREALELRIATEHTWRELCDVSGEEEATAMVVKHRARLADHYKLVSDELSRRRESLHQLRDQLARHESELRRQRLEVQMWVDRQRNEIDAKLAELAVRESELDRRETEFQRDSILWQSQRESYRREIESLSRRAKKV